MGPADRYLAEVAAHLTLPDEPRAEILEELAAHIGDAAADLRAAGHEPDVAEMEALARLGPPATIARALVAARRGPAQLLAAAGAGTWAALGSGVYGALTGWVVVVIASVVGLIITHWAVDALGVYFRGWAGGWNTVLTALVLAVGAYTAGAAATRGVARRDWWAASEIRGDVAVIGAITVAFLILVVYEASLNWASVLALILVPCAFAAGTRIETPPLRRFRDLGVLLVAALVIVLVGSFATWAAAGHPDSYSWNEETLGAGILPPWWGGSPDSAHSRFDASTSTSTALGTESVEYDAVSQQAIAQLRDFRLEAWIGEPPHDDWHLVPGQTRPFAVAPAQLDGTTLSGTIVFNQVPEVDWAGVVLTAVGPDGQRYLLDVSGLEQTEFFGSVFSWFAALAR